MANSEDPVEMPLNVAFHQGLHCLLKQNRSSEKENNLFGGGGGGGGGNVTFDPFIYTMDHHDSFVCSFKENSIGLISVFVKPTISGCWLLLVK